MRNPAPAALLVFVLPFLGCRPAEETRGTPTSAPAPAPASALERPAEPDRGEPESPGTASEDTPAPPAGESLFESPPAKRYLEAVDVVNAARQAERAGKKDQALELLEQALEIHPQLFSAAVHRARLLRESGRHAESLAVATACLEHNPGNPSLLLEKARTLDAAGEPARALEVLDDVFEAGNALPDGRWLRTLILARAEDREGTAASLQDAFENGFGDLGRLEPELEKSLAFIAEDERVQAIVGELRERRAAFRATAKRLLEEHQRSAGGALGPQTLLDPADPSTYYRGTAGPGRSSSYSPYTGGNAPYTEPERSPERAPSDGTDGSGTGESP